MAYTPQTWANIPATTTAVSAARLAHMETGIDEAHDVAAAAATAVTTRCLPVGDLGGTASAPIVAKVNGVAVTGTPTVGQVLTATSGIAAVWQSTGRVVAVSSSATPTINVDTTDQADILTLVHNITGITFSGTSRHGQRLFVVFKSASSQTIAWGSGAQNGPAVLLTATVPGRYHEVGLKYNSGVSKWVCMAVDAVGY